VSISLLIESNIKLVDKISYGTTLIIDTVLLCGARLL